MKRVICRTIIHLPSESAELQIELSAQTESAGRATKERARKPPLEREIRSARSDGTRAIARGAEPGDRDPAVRMWTTVRPAVRRASRSQVEIALPCPLSNRER